MNLDDKVRSEEMKKIIMSVTLFMGLLMSGCTSDEVKENNSQKTETGKIENKEKEEAVSGASQGEDAVTSATIVPKDLVSTFEPKGFTKETTKKKVLFVVADPREESITNALGNAAMAFFEKNQFEVEKRDLYQLNFNPVLTLENFYQAKDGSGETPEDIAIEQGFVTKSQHIIFVYPNWHDTPTPLIKGYMERVFAKQFAYKDGERGLEGLLVDKDIYTIMNAGYLGGGQGDVGDGIGQNDEAWDKYMNAFKVLDDDTAAFWGAKNKGRFVNDQSPKNDSKTYKKELEKLIKVLENQLTSKYL